MQKIPRSEYPRPEATRSADSWLCLNGSWEFEFDLQNIGMKQGWFQQPHFSKNIVVPFVYESQLSGINDQRQIDRVWYTRTFKVPTKNAKNNILLHFGAVDYECNVFVNGALVGFHRGGSVPFEYDITPYLKPEVNADQLIVVAVRDYPTDPQIPRGKQSVKLPFSGCDYENVTGIWQTVWLEFVGPVYLDREDTYIRADPFTGEVQINIITNGTTDKDCAVECQLFDDNTPISDVQFVLRSKEKLAMYTNLELAFQVDPQKISLWSPANPKLYRAHFRLVDANADDESTLDELECSFGFREFTINGNQILLNGQPLYLKFALYQGYWPTGLWTAPTDEDIRKDMQLTLDMGFNGLRLHQKVEDPRLMYWADKLGVILWGEICNAFNGTSLSKQLLIEEWIARVKRDRNHAAVMAWIPANESWGVRPLDRMDCREYLKALYRLTKSLDPSRMVNANDGWEQVTGSTDICSFHLYQNPEEFAKTLPEARPRSFTNFHGVTPYAPGYDYQGEPVIVSEWGGWGFFFDEPNTKPDHFKCWGYQGILHKSWEKILELYGDEIKLLVKRKSWITGHVYTEFCDQYQEMNGFLTFDRRPKGELKQLKALNDLL